MIFKNEIKKEYLQTKEILKSNFQDAFRFLDFIEKLNNKGFHVGTHKNLHLYFKNSFLFYFSKVYSRAIKISSKPNGILKKQTFNHSDYFFKLLIKELQSELNCEKNIEIGSNKGYEIIIEESEQSEQCFNSVKNALTEIEKKEDSIELSNQIVQAIDEFQVFNNNKDQSLTEGIRKVIKTTYYERNSKARNLCLKHMGTKCSICGFDFEKVYGKIGKGFIHVHHLTPIAQIGESYQINPNSDLIPVCPNCHAMIHSKNPPRTIDEMKKIINISQQPH